MPSPFPGMDPFLEHPGRFHGFHNKFITYLEEILQPLLPEPYYATSGERVWLEAARRSLEPDVDVLHNNRASPEVQNPGVVAVATPVCAEPVIVQVPFDEHRETFLELYRADDSSQRLVCSIEVLSLSNKTPGAHGREPYLRKQQELLGSQVHLVEIDLLRAGTHTTAVPRNLAVARTGPFDYHVCVHRFDRWAEYAVYPIHLEQRLPAIAIPLLPGAPSVRLDLQAVFDRCYDTGAYRRTLRYTGDVPGPALRPEHAEWVRRLLQEKALLPPAAAS